MCTAATYRTHDFYMGRTLDYEFSYPSEVTIMPRRFPIHLRHGTVLTEHYAIIGMAYVTEDYPLYYDAINEKGLGMAGLNFVGNAVYSSPCAGKENIAQFEFIPWLLARCADLQEARNALETLNLTDTPFNSHLPSASLHWIIADESGAIVVESMADGLHIYDNPVGVLTNNPPFPQQLAILNRYRGLSSHQPENTFAPEIELPCYSRGMGAKGLPGDLSSDSRFVRVAFTRANSVSSESEPESVSQFFHILGSVEQVRGCCEVSPNEYEITIYTSCCNASRGIYYYTTYENSQITAVDMHRTDLNSEALTRYPLLPIEIRQQN